MGCYKLDPYVKRKWIKALRSGDYKQGKKRLRRDDRGDPTTWCCLGVLAAEMVPEFIDRPGSYIEGFGLIPDDVAVFWALDFEAQRLLARMNDGGKKSFAEIADWIEENL